MSSRKQNDKHRKAVEAAAQECVHVLTEQFLSEIHEDMKQTRK